jgi:capsular polysaccharide biosynthesis protein
MRNEDELIAALEARGFAAVYPSYLSIPQQVHLFRDAECLVGPHGSGMINVAYMAEGRHVVEISPVIANPNFWIARLSAVLGLRYAAVVCDVADEDCDDTTIYGVTRRHLSFRYDVDVAAVLRALDTFGFH